MTLLINYKYKHKIKYHSYNLQFEHKIDQRMWLVDQWPFPFQQFLQLDLEDYFE